MKKILFGLIILFLILPFTQQSFNVIQMKPLHGAYNTPAPPDLKTFTWSSWFSGSFQYQFNNRIEENIGLRNSFIRINNQIDYTFYKKANANNIVVGLNRYLYNVIYINAYLGTDFTGKYRLREKSWKIRYLQNLLKGMNQQLLILLAPGKGSFYPEHFPYDYQGRSTGITNYNSYLGHFNKLNIEYIDFRSFFYSLKNTLPYTLFPKCGIHWSTYGMAIASDSLIKFIGNKLNYPLPLLQYEAYPTNDSVQHSGYDYDIAYGMNLLFQIHQPELSYVDFHMPDTCSFTKPSVLVIGDSYYKNLIKAGIPEFYFSQPAFWYYNREIYPKPEKGSAKVKDYDLKTEINKYQAIILIATDANLSRFPFGFIDDLFQIYPPNNDSLIHDYYRFVLHDHPDFIQDTLAINQKILDETLKNERLDFYRRIIKINPEFLNSIFKKANQRNLPIEEMIRLDAAWLYKHEDDR